MKQKANTSLRFNILFPIWFNLYHLIYLPKLSSCSQCLFCDQFPLSSLCLEDKLRKYRNFEVFGEDACSSSFMSFHSAMAWEQVVNVRIRYSTSGACFCKKIIKVTASSRLWIVFKKEWQGLKKWCAYVLLELRNMMDLGMEVSAFEFNVFLWCCYYSFHLRNLT